MAQGFGGTSNPGGGRCNWMFNGPMFKLTAISLGTSGLSELIRCLWDSPIVEYGVTSAVHPVADRSVDGEAQNRLYVLLGGEPTLFITVYRKPI